MSSIRVLAAVAGLSLDAIRTETALRHGLHWCREGSAGVVVFLDSTQLWHCFRGGPNAVKSHDYRAVDLVLPADPPAATALRRHGGLLAQATDPAAYCWALLATLARDGASVALLCPGAAAAEALSSRIRAHYPNLRVPVTHLLAPDQADPWAKGGVPPEDLADLTAARTCLTLMIGPGDRAPVTSAVALAHATRQVVVALSAAQGRGLVPTRALAGLPGMVGPSLWSRTRAAFWARFLA